MQVARFCAGAQSPTGLGLKQGDTRPELSATPWVPGSCCWLLALLSFSLCSWNWNPHVIAQCKLKLRSMFWVSWEARLCDPAPVTTTTSILFTSNHLYWECRWKLTSQLWRKMIGLLVACLGRLLILAPGRRAWRRCLPALEREVSWVCDLCRLGVRMQQNRKKTKVLVNDFITNRP